MHHIYCISGLGADDRIFQNLKISNAILHFIQWEIPGEKDTMKSYALKLARQIKHDQVILMGVSFGGMLVTEIANHLSELDKPVYVEKTILISSCKTNIEMPLFLRLAGRMGIHKIVPYQFILRNNTLNRIAFARNSQQSELQVKRQMLASSSIEYIKRSINIIFNWKCTKVPDNLIHIHGSNDRLLRPLRVKADYWIKDAGHFMIWNRADEISVVIDQLLQKEQAILYAAA